jgi:hypothetical protein
MGVKATPKGIRLGMVGMVVTGAHLVLVAKEALGGVRPPTAAGMETLDGMGIFVNSQHHS